MSHTPGLSDLGYTMLNLLCCAGQARTLATAASESIIKAHGMIPGMPRVDIMDVSAAPPPDHHHLTQPTPVLTLRGPPPSPLFPDVT